MRHSFLKIYLVGLGFLFLTGCAGISDLKRTDEYTQAYYVGDYATAIASIGGKTGLDYDEENLLSALHVGSAQFANGQFESSTISFERAENQLYWKADKIDSVAEVGRAIGTSLTNDLAAKYTGNIYEGALINTYKALSAIHLGNLDNARVEFNRAAVRQDNAVYQLAAKVRQSGGRAGADDDEEVEKRHLKQIGRATNDATKADTELGRRLAAVESIKKYKNLRNPLTDYLHGIFRLVTGDTNKASDLLRNAVVLTDKNSYVVNDWKLAEKAASQTSGKIAPRVWVIYEDGIGPTLEEFRIDLPAFLISDNLLYAGVAIPELVPGKKANGDIKITASGKQISTEIILDMDALVASEFATTYKRTVTKAISSAIIKAIIAKQINDEAKNYGVFGAVLQLATAVSQVALNRADTRIWKTLPNTVGVASMPYPEDGTIEIQTSNGDIVRIDLGSGGYNAGHTIITTKAVTNNVITYNVARLD